MSSQLCKFLEALNILSFHDFSVFYELGSLEVHTHALQIWQRFDVYNLGHITDEYQHIWVCTQYQSWCSWRILNVDYAISL